MGVKASLFVVPELKQSSNSMAVCESLGINVDKKNVDKKPPVLANDEMKPPALEDNEKRPLVLEDNEKKPLVLEDDDKKAVVLEVDSAGTYVNVKKRKLVEDVHVENLFAGFHADDSVKKTKRQRVSKMQTIVEEDEQMLAIFGEEDNC